MSLNVLVMLLICALGAVKSDIYSYSITDLQGKKVDFEAFSGKVLLIVNVASECGYTDSHYRELQKLQESFGPSGKFSVIAFPCNQFGGQEPGTPQEIRQFVTQYRVSFPIMTKVDVVGEQADQLWQQLVRQSGVAPTWNFYKYLVDHNGDVVGAWPHTSPVKELLPVVLSAVFDAESQVQVESPLHVMKAAEHDEL